MDLILKQLKPVSFFKTNEVVLIYEENHSHRGAYYCFCDRHF